MNPRLCIFRVRTTEGKRYILRYKERDDEWTLQSGFDGDELLAKPNITVVTIDTNVVRQAQDMIESCEHCNENAEIPFDWILDRVTGHSGATTDYILETAAKWPTASVTFRESLS